MSRTHLTTLLAILAVGVGLACGRAEAAAPASLAGGWTITTTPAISGQGGRGKPVTPTPIALALTTGKPARPGAPTPLTGTMTLWKGDYEARDAVTGSVDGRKVVLRTASYTFTGAHDPATGVVTGTVVETPSGAPAGGTRTTFRMAR